MLRDDERAALAESLFEDDGPKRQDPELLTAIRELTAAVRAIEAVDLSPVARAVAAMPDPSDGIESLRSDIRALAVAVSKIEPVDLSGVVDALNEMRTTKRALIQVMMSPREIMFDAEGNPTGVRIARVN